MKCRARSNEFLVFNKMMQSVPKSKLTVSTVNNSYLLCFENNDFSFISLYHIYIYLYLLEMYSVEKITKHNENLRNFPEFIGFVNNLLVNS